MKTYLHPPTFETGTGGIPDYSVQSSVVTNFRNEFSLGCPSTWKTWSALLITQPSPQIPLWSVIWEGAGSPTASSFLHRSFENPSFGWGDGEAWSKTASQMRPIAGSLTVYLDAASLYNQGRIYCAQGSAEVTYQTPDKTELDVLVVLGQLPTEGSEIMNMSSKSVSHLAKEGMFTVQRFVDPSVQYLRASTQQAMVEAYLRLEDGTTVVIRDGFGNRRMAGWYPGMSLSYVLVKGLLGEATLSMKRPHAWETIPAPGSTWGPFASPGPCPDAAALELAAVQQHAKRDGDVAAANDLGSFLGGLLPTVRKVWNVAAPVAKTILSTTPKGRVVAGVIDGLGQVINPQASGTRSGQVAQVAAPQVVQQSAPQPMPASLTRGQRRRARRRARRGE